MLGCILAAHHASAQSTENTRQNSEAESDMRDLHMARRTPARSASAVARGERHLHLGSHPIHALRVASQARATMQSAGG